MKTNITLEEFYKKIGGSYESACAEYKDEEKLMEEAVKFLHDSSFAEIQTYIAASDYSGAHSSAEALAMHCKKLCFTELGNAAELIKNKLCNTDTFDDIALFAEVRNKYEHTVNELRILEQEN